jgi:hypothetical protein
MSDTCNYGESPDTGMRLGGHNDKPGSDLSDNHAMIASLQAKLLEAEKKTDSTNSRIAS